MDAPLRFIDSSVDIRSALRLAANIIAGHETQRRRKRTGLTNAVPRRVAQHVVVYTDRPLVRPTSTAVHDAPPCG